MKEKFNLQLKANVKMTLYKLFFKNMTLWFTKHQEMIKGATGVDHKTKDIKGRNKIISI